MVTKKQAPLPKLSKVIRDEIRMTCALRGFSTLIEGSRNTKNRQFDQMYHFYHGKKTHRPSQIRMLCQGQGIYSAMYDSFPVIVTSKNGTTESVTRLHLKPSLHRDLNINYRADYDLVSEDLERKTVNNPLLVTGRSLHVLAKKGISYYRKALSFTSTKWDIKKNEPKESGCTVADVIDYVRREMYKDIYDIPTEDQDSEEEDDYNEVDEGDEENESNDGDAINKDGEDDTATKSNAESPSPKKTDNKGGDKYPRTTMSQIIGIFPGSFLLWYTVPFQILMTD